MKYKYYRLSNTLVFKQTAENEVEAIELTTDKAYTMDGEIASYIKSLDGKTHPYRIKTDLTREEIQSNLRYLYKEGLISRSKIKFNGISVQRPLWKPKSINGLKAAGRVLNLALMLLFIPVFVYGAIAVYNAGWGMGVDHIWWGFVLGLIAGVTVHELGHAFVAFAYGATVCEMGVMLMYFVLPCAYVFADSRELKNRMRRIQIKAAGVEANLLLAGVFFVLSAFFRSLGGMFLIAGINNVFLCILNLSLVAGFDGGAIFAELFGSESFLLDAIEAVFNRSVREKLKKRKATGYATLVMCYLLTLSQLLLPLFIITNLWEVVLCFV